MQMIFSGIVFQLTDGASTWRMAYAEPFSSDLSQNLALDRSALAPLRITRCLLMATHMSSVSRRAAVTPKVLLAPGEW